VWRWVWFRIYPDQSEKSGADFLRRLKRVAPFKIQMVPTDNGSQFSDRFTSKNKQVSGQHAFDQACATHGIDHRLAPPGMRKAMAWSSVSMAVSPI
jgi:hypothetical protein